MHRYRPYHRSIIQQPQAKPQHYIPARRPIDPIARAKIDSIHDHLVRPVWNSCYRYAIPLVSPSSVWIDQIASLMQQEYPSDQWAFKKNYANQTELVIKQDLPLQNVISLVTPYSVGYCSAETFRTSVFPIHYLLWIDPSIRDNQQKPAAGVCLSFACQDDAVLFSLTYM